MCIPCWKFEEIILEEPPPKPKVKASAEQTPTRVMMPAVTYYSPQPVAPGQYGPNLNVWRYRPPKPETGAAPPAPPPPPHPPLAPAQAIAPKDILTYKPRPANHAAHTQPVASDPVALPGGPMNIWRYKPPGKAQSEKQQCAPQAAPAPAAYQVPAGYYPSYPAPVALQYPQFPYGYAPYGHYAPSQPVVFAPQPQPPPAPAPAAPAAKQHVQVHRVWPGATKAQIDAENLRMAEKFGINKAVPLVPTDTAADKMYWFRDLDGNHYLANYGTISSELSPGYWVLGPQGTPMFVREKKNQQ
ncbi:hypothetical protein L228DRAFT_240722 [Xylona heveae TC161]|uniref:Uncharacterized protein n=1 Tax=Xylona heveae (strain CBS 132557 / TC161) TaxID=1328760 RepID=A0A165AAF9_XYLHT|nr:hypothetical protein L228DRAFT_240722 [Xylona heveae TC161]KZF20170.1 hypothetical protein L228DRAFT_240722 [Xylona heveae TC161]